VKILVAEPLAEEGLSLLRAEHDVDTVSGLTRSELLARLPDYDALIVRSGVKVDAEAFALGTRLVVVGRAGTGLDNIDLDAAARAGVTVVNAPDANTIAAAEHTLALMYALARRIPAADASLRAGQWRRSDFVGVELSGKTLGILGLGRIGLAVADRARAMQMALIGSDPFVAIEAAASHGIRLVELTELLTTADVVAVHAPLTPATRGLVGRAELALMKPTALLVNAARGGIVDEVALAEALATDRLAGAAVDVFAGEPLPADSPLRRAPNTVLTPHLGASTAEAQVRAGTDTARRVLEVLAGRRARSAAER
jgi:D-3-phosphoglycerate dehydrogenase / 2-oxoglutarate reductase